MPLRSLNTSLLFLNLLAAFRSLNTSLLLLNLLAVEQPVQLVLLHLNDLLLFLILLYLLAVGPPVKGVQNHPDPLSRSFVNQVETKFCCTSDSNSFRFAPMKLARWDLVPMT